MNQSVIIWNLILFFICLVFSISMVLEMQKNRALRKKIKRRVRKMRRGFLQKLSKNSDDRRKAEEQLRMEEGLQEKTNLFYRIDLALEQSGLARKFTFLSTELFLLLVLASGILMYIMVSKITEQWIFGMAAAAMTFLGYYIVIFIMTSRNYEKVEDSLVQFAGLLENYSKTSDDIISIFGKVAMYLDEPLKTAVNECYMEALTTGDVEAAFNHLELKIEHPKFRELVQNIEICSRYEANYETVIRANRRSLRQYIAAKTERKQMINSARVNIVMLICCGAIAVYMIGGIVETSGGLPALLLNTTLGNIFLLYGFFVVLYAIWKMISMGRKE